MKRLIQPVLLCGLLFIFSCNKHDQEPAITGQWKWTVEYTPLPNGISTPQTTGIQETLLFKADGTYSLTQNNSVVHTGTYTFTTATSQSGQHVQGISYTNNNVTDSVAYYEFRDNNNTLFFSYDLLGAVGSSERLYSRE